MRITSVETHLVHCAIPEEHRVRSGAGYKLARQGAFVEITTDEGITGIGPCSFGSASLDLGSVATLIDNTFAPALIGEDPGAIERLWDKFYYGSIARVHGPRGLGVAMLSAVDIALWDIKGKALGAPSSTRGSTPSRSRSDWTSRTTSTRFSPSVTRWARTST
jgi:L-alanine-DL-glutamate epimerase-like enolase superfamily enzyme